MTWLGKAITNLFRGPSAEKTGFEEVYDRLVQEIDLKEQKLEENSGTIVLWISLSGATEYKSSRELATALTKVYRHNRIAQQIISNNKGTVIKLLSDGLVATFIFNGSDSALNALLVTLKIQEEFARINRAIPNKDDQIKSQIGITAGFVIDFSSYNPIGEEITDPQGSVVDLAEQLASLAKPDQILTHDIFADALPSSHERFKISNYVQRRLPGFVNPINVFEVIWDNQIRDISFPAPIFIESGYLTSEFINEQIRAAKFRVMITGHTNRRFTNDFDFRNLLAEKIEVNPDFTIEMIFLNPYSAFKIYSQQITRRRMEDIEPLVIDSIYNGCLLFRQLVPNIKFYASEYSMIIPFVQRDEELFFALPIRSHPEGRKFIGMTGGPYFWSQVESPIAQEILQNHFQQNDRVELDIDSICGNNRLIKATLTQNSDISPY